MKRIAVSVPAVLCCLLALCSLPPEVSDFASLVNLKIAPDGSNIAFIGYERSFSKSVFVIPVGGGTARRIAGGDEFDWTPDGKSLIVADRRGMYLVDIAAGTEKEVFKNQLPYFCHRIGCNPVTPEVLFVSSFMNKNSELYKVNYNDLKVYRLTDNLHEDDYPRWSADGKRITYLSNHMPFIMDASGGGKTMLMEKLSDAQPVFSPDGKSVALTMLVAKKSEGTEVSMNSKGYLQINKKDYDRAIFEIRTDGSDFNEITDGLNPVYNAGGTRILFEFLGGGTMPHLYTYRFDAERFTRLLPEAVDSTYSLCSPAWFPGADELAAVTLDAMDNPNGICVMKGDGTGYRRIFSF